MNPLERSEGAKGRITFAVSNILTNEPHEDNIATYNNYLHEAQAEVLNYESGERQDIGGGLALLYRTEFKSKMATVLGDYMNLDPRGLEIFLDNLWKNIHTLSLEKIVKKIQDNRWDILLLLNGAGTPLHLALVMEAFIQEQGDTSVTTIATSKAKSGHAMIFGAGKKRIALPSTEFLLHDATNTRINTCVIDDSMPILKQHSSDKLNQVVFQTLEKNRQSINEKAKKQLEAEGNNDRKIEWEGSESPGYITDYLSEEDPLPKQIATIIGRPINPAKFQTDVVARFALESEVERRMRQEGYDLSVFSIRDQWKIISKEKIGEETSSRFEEIVMELMTESGHANAKIKSNENP